MIARVDAPIDPRGGVDFLGPEFLTWLWWRSDAEPRFVHPDGSEVFVHLDDHLELRGERAAARRTILRAGVPGGSLEARAALRSGKTLVAARLLLARDEEEVRFTLRAEDLDVSSLKLPAPEGDTAVDREQHLLSMQGQFLDDLDLCLATFLAARCSPAWEQEVSRMCAWGLTPSQDEQAGVATLD